ncbi:MAG: mechanosensitive ion channel [Desulfurivibrionaceae bacterium]|nr:mechanosensitive ion channel [Desulfobulbales bacterium]MDT8334672.1 mechanosensitive ion channel [Desulfurivibrionaceae bacterium]
MDFGALLDSFLAVKENIFLKRLIVIAAYLVLVKIADLLIDKFLRKAAGLTRMTVDDHLIDYAHKPACWTIFWLGVLHALIVAPLAEPWQTILPPAVRSMILLIWTIALIRITNWAFQARINRASPQDKIGKDVLLLLKNVIGVILIVSAIFWLLTIWKISLTPLFASAGIAGIAIALAAKDTLANFFGGISIFLDRIYKIGDYIIVDNTDRGEVMEIGIRSTRIKTRDDVMITIPNSIMSNSKIINESAPVPRFRIRVPFGVAYGSDLEQVEKIVLAVAGANPNVSPEPASRVRLRSFADSSVNFELLCWVEHPAGKGLEIHNLLKAIYRAFGEKGVVIPFPQRDIHIRRTPPAEESADLQ